MKDLTGEKFGKLTVLSFSHRNGSNYYWNCKCDCGNEKAVNIKYGIVESCGCTNGLQDIVGQKYNKLTVIGFSHITGKKGNFKYHWNCSCECGGWKTVRADKLKSGHTKSCGCINFERMDLTNLKLGRLTMLSSYKNEKNYIIWLCECECGNVKPILQNSLTKTKQPTRSCGCLARGVDRSGENNPYYNENLTDEDRARGRSIAGYGRWVRSVLERDNFTCQCCMKKSDKIVAHHLECYSKNEELRTDVDNGVTLCEKCHKKFHSKKYYGVGNNTKEQYCEFIEREGVKKMVKKCYITFGGELRTGGVRIKNNLIKYAPEDIEIVDSYEEADFIVMHHQYKQDLDWFLHNCKKPFIFLISELQQSKEYFQEFFSNPFMKMTYTFHPLRHLGYVSEEDKKSHVLAPWGFDEELFNANPYDVVHTDRPNTIFAMGFYDSEHYHSQYDAVRMTNGFMMHTDIKIWDFLRQGKFFDPQHHWYTEWVSDEELIKIYQSCKFVSGLRSGSGFEVGVLEGLVNGCRPICFDNIYYRQFFNDFALFIPEDFDVDMTQNLVHLFRDADMYKVNSDEIKYVREKFKWETIATNFWKEVEKSL